MKILKGILKRIAVRNFSLRSQATHNPRNAQSPSHNGSTPVRSFRFTSPYLCGYLTFIGLRSEDGGKGKANKTCERDWLIEKNINKCILRAEKFIKEGNLEEAEKTLEEALKKHAGKQTVGVTCLYDMLATLAFTKGDLSRARELLDTALAYLRDAGLPADHVELVRFRLKIARLLSMVGQDQEAETNFRQCVETQRLKQNLGLMDEETIMLQINCLFWYGKHLIKNKKYTEAKNLLDNAYTLSAKAKALENEQIMVILYHLSDAMLALREIEGALRHLLIAVLIGRMSNSPELPTYYTRLGEIYLRKGLLREARHWCHSGWLKGKALHNKQAEKDGEECIAKINRFFGK